MDFRKTYGGMVEDALNIAVDKYLDAGELKALLNKEVDKFVDEKLAGIKDKLKRDVIDLIDGEDDIK